MVNSYHIESGGGPGGNRLAAILGDPGTRGEGGALDVRPPAPRFTLFFITICIFHFPFIFGLLCLCMCILKDPT